jgi:hypothetical protein
MADTSVIVFPFLQQGDAAGQTVTAPAADARPTPHVHLRWKEDGRRQTKIVSSGYTMHLRFGQPTDNFLPGRIELEVPGGPTTKFSGEFQAEMR